MYSDSVDESVTVGCFFAAQDTAPPAKQNKYPPTDFLSTSHLQSHLSIKRNSKIAGSTEVFENVVRGGVMFLRRMVVELRDLRYRICEIGTSAKHCVHEAADFRLVDFTVDCRFFLLVELNEFNSMRDGNGCRFDIKHLKLLKNHIDIPVLPNRNRLVGTIAIDLNAEEEC